MRWLPIRLLVLTPIRYRRMPCPLDVPSIGLQRGLPLVVLENVQVRVDAELWLNPDKAPRDEADNHRKYAEMFLRRLGQQKLFRPAYFGLETFPARLSAATGAEQPVPIDLEWGPMPGDAFGEPLLEGVMRGGVVQYTSPFR